MSTPVGSLAVVLNLRTGAFSSGLTRAGTQVQAFAGQLTAVQGAAAGMATRLLALVGVGGGLAGLGVGISQAAERIDALAKTSDKLGLATEALAGFQYAASQTGVSSEAADTALQRLVVKVAEAAQGGAQAQAVFAQLGVAVDDLRRRTPDQQMRVLADAFAGVGGQAERVRLAVELFGREGAAMVNVLALGSAGLDAMQTEAGKLGLALTRVDAAKVEMAGDAVDRLKLVFAGVFNQLAVQLAPIIAWVAQGFVDAATAGDSLGSTIGAVVDAGVKGVGFLADAWQGIVLAFRYAQVAATWAFQQVLSGIDAVIRAGQWWAEFFSRAFAVITAGWNDLGATVAVIGQGIRQVFAGAVAFAGSQMADLLRRTGEAVAWVDDGLAASIQGAGQRLQGAVTQVAAQAQADFDAAAAAAIAARAATRQAWDTLASPIAPAGSDTLHAMIDGLQALQDSQWAEIDTLRQQRLASDVVWEGYQNLQAQAETQARAVAAAAEASRLPPELPSEDPAIIADEVRNQTLEAMAQEHQDSLTGIYQQGLADRERFNQMSLWGQAHTVVESVAQSTAILAQHSKKWFQIHKAAASANAVVSTAEGVARALGAFPPPLNFAMAGLVAAAGTAQIAAINAASYGGGGRGGALVADSLPGDTTGSWSGSGSGNGLGGNGGTTWRGAEDPGGGDQVQLGGRTYARQTLIVQGDYLRAEDLERLSRETRERNILITEIRRA